MSGNEDLTNLMIPKVGSSKINLPLTFDYNGGRKEYNKSRLIWVGILIVLGLILGIGTILSDEGIFIVNLLLGIGVMYGVSLIVRFPIMKEHIVRNNMLQMIDNDYKEGYNDYWGVYTIEDVYPYYVHFRNGETALFVRFEKDVILGRVPENEYEHYEAISDAYNLASSFNIKMCHIDYMDVIGNDDRLDNCFRSLSDVSNPDMQDLLTDVYTNLQSTMDDMVSTFDVYVYKFKYSEASFWFRIQQVISCMLDANYVSFTILNVDEIRNLARSLPNLHDFSVIEACASTFGKDRKAGVIPIRISRYDGSEEKLGKTLEEKRKDEEEYNIKKKSKKKEVKVDENEIDLFED